MVAKFVNLSNKGRVNNYNNNNHNNLVQRIILTLNGCTYGCTTDWWWIGVKCLQGLVNDDCR